MSYLPLSFHESGHSVLAYIAGIDIDFVTIAADAQTLGVCQCNHDSFMSASPALKIAFFMAGPIGEAWHLNAEPKLEGDDRRRVFEIVRDIYGQDVDVASTKEFKLGFEYASSVIENNTDCLKAAAFELLEMFPAKCRSLDSVFFQTIAKRPKEQARRLAAEKAEFKEIERLRELFNAGEELSQDELIKIGEAAIEPQATGLAALYEMAFESAKAKLA